MSLPSVKSPRLDALAQKALRALKDEHRTWQAVSGWISRPGSRPFNVGLLWQVANGKKSAPNSLLLALGLPLKEMPAAPCRNCGEVHTTKRCAKKTRQRERAKRRDWKRFSAFMAALWMKNTLS